MARSPQLAVLEELLPEDEPLTEPVDEEDFLPAVGQSIVTPKAVCEIIRTNIKDTLKANEAVYLKWDASFRQYRLCGDEGVDKENDVEYNFHFKNNTDENIIRTTVRSLMRATYMQNPHIEFTGEDEDKKLADTLEYTLKFMMNKPTYPGLNMKIKVRRWIMHGQLTNFGVMRLDYQPHDGSRQEAIEFIKKLEDDLTKVKSQEEAREVIAKLNIAHRDLPITQNKGLAVTNVMPNCLIVDPSCTLPDLSDANWVAEEFYESRDFIEQKYYQHNEDGTKTLRSNTKVVVQPDGEAADEDVSARIVETVMEHKDEDKQSLALRDKIKCYYYYDKILRRRYLFSDEDWKHPLWVEEDDMNLSRFFRHFILPFGEPIEDIVQPGEVSYYVGQVEEINKINKKIANIRDRVFNIILYNTQDIDKQEVEKMINALRSPAETQAIGIANKSEKKINEILEVLAPPSVQYEQLFDTRNLRASIDRSASTSAVDRGEQFKANTTQDAVAYAAQTRQETVGIVVDAIEDAFEALAWSICEVLVSKYSKEEIAGMIGQKKAADFQQMTVDEFNQKFRMQIAAGSIEKPTTEYKKKEAITVSQSIGQMGQAAPGATLRILLRMFQTAFGTVVTQEDWDMLEKEALANITKGQSNAQGTTGRPPQQPPQPSDGGRQ